MIEISNFRQGAVLNHNHGVECENALRIVIEGISSSGYPVYVNGVKASMDGQRFTADIDLTEKINIVKAQTTTPYGTYAQELTLVWDKKSFRRYDFYIDDHSFLFTDLAKERPKSAFDHFYLKALKNIRNKYDFKVTLNCFYHNDHHNFDLKDMPDIWKSEFIDNSDWLKFSFHSYSEFPDRPYLETTREAFARDWDLVQNEIYRFAGEASYIAPVMIHWANIHPVATEEFISRGSKVYCGFMRPRVMGGPSLTERQAGCNMNNVNQNVRDQYDNEALMRHYGFLDEVNYLKNHGVMYNPGLGIGQYGYCSAIGGCTCNLVPKPEITRRMHHIFERGSKVGLEIYHAGSHEQYSYPYYQNYLPDHMERIEEAVRCLTEEGNCKAAFYNHGFFGNTAWEEE